MAEINEHDLVQFLKVRPKRRARLGLRCLNEFDLAAYADHLVTEEERANIQAHLADCESCLDQVRFLVRVRKIAAPDSIPGALLSRARQLAGSEARHTIRPAWLWGAVGGVAAGLVVVAALTLRQHQRQPRATYPEAPATPSVQMPSESGQADSSQHLDVPTLRNRAANSQVPAVLYPLPESTVLRSAVEFRWEPVRATLYYQVRLVTAEGEPVWEQRTEKTSVRLPRGVNLTSGHKYFVSVRAHLEEGKNVRSKAVPFSVIDRK